MQTQYLSLDGTLHQAASDLAERIDRVSDHLMAANKSPTMQRRLEQCADSIHRKYEQLQRASESNNSDQVALTWIHLLKEMRRFYQMLGAVDENY